jgi:putative membrane protein
MSDAVIDTAPAETPTGEGERLHPLGLLAGFIAGIPQLIFPMLAALFGIRDTGLGMPAIIGLVLLVSLFFRWIGWLRFRFYLGEDDIRIERGILNRTIRSIPYDRIQDVSIEEKPLARLMGLGEVKFETGSGDGEDAKLSFVGMDRAEALRETVRTRKAEAVGVDATPDVETQEGAPVFAMDNRRLLTLGLYSFSLVIFAVLGGVANQMDFLLPFDFWDIGHWIGLAEDRGVSMDNIGLAARIIGAIFALLALIAIGIATGIGRTFLKEYGFRLERTERGFRRRRGLLTKTDVVMPVNRVQAATIVTGPIRKRSGWHALKFISLAQDSKDDKDHMAAPLAKLEEIWPIMAEAKLLPPGMELSFARLPKGPWVDLWLMLTLAIILVIGIVYEASAVFAWWTLLIAPLLGFFVWHDWRHRSQSIDARQLYARHGWWQQNFDIARQVNVHSVTISQGPLIRRRGLANLDFGIAGGSLSFSAVPLEEARAIRDQVMAMAAPVDFSELAAGRSETTLVL